MEVGWTLGGARGLLLGGRGADAVAYLDGLRNQVRLSPFAQAPFRAVLPVDTAGIARLEETATKGAQDVVRGVAAAVVEVAPVGEMACPFDAANRVDIGEAGRIVGGGAEQEVPPDLCELIARGGEIDRVYSYIARARTTSW